MPCIHYRKSFVVWSNYRIAMVGIGVTKAMCGLFLNMYYNH